MTDTGIETDRVPTFWGADRRSFDASASPDRDALLRFIYRNREDLNVAWGDEPEQRAREWAQNDFSFLVEVVRPQRSGYEFAGFAAVERGGHESVAHVGSLRLAVDRAYWGRGLGSSLIRDSVAEAQVGGQILRLEASPYMPLSPWKYGLFVKDGGFEIEGIRRAAARSVSTGALLDVLSLVRTFGEAA
jgi:GNAT superfamily N-acetyltransferase